MVDKSGAVTDMVATGINPTATLNFLFEVTTRAAWVFAEIYSRYFEVPNQPFFIPYHREVSNQYLSGLPP